MPEYHLTANKKDELEIELKERKSVKRPDILEKLEAARELGDLKENAEYHAMRDEQGRNESRIREIEELLKFAVVVEKGSGAMVELASHVTVRKGDEKETKEFSIVGPAEADIATGKIASTSPLGQALLHKAVGDVAIVETPKGNVEYTIINIT